MQRMTGRVISAMHTVRAAAVQTQRACTTQSCACARASDLQQLRGLLLARQASNSLDGVYSLPTWSQDNDKTVQAGAAGPPSVRHVRLLRFRARDRQSSQPVMALT